MIGRAARSLTVVAACWAVVTHLEDVARYLRTRDLSRRDALRRPWSDDDRSDGQR